MPCFMNVTFSVVMSDLSTQPNGFKLLYVFIFYISMKDILLTKVCVFYDIYHVQYVVAIYRFTYVGYVQ